MSDERLDELAQRLFQAARAERPGPPLRQRVRALGAGDAGMGDAAASHAPPASGARGATRAGARARTSWLATAGLLSAAAAVLLFLGKRTLEPETEVRISAEARSPSVAAGRAAPAIAERTPEAAPQRTEERPASPATVQNVPGTEAPAPAAPAAARAPSATPKRAAPPPAQPAGEAGASRRPPLAEQLELLKQARALLRSGESMQALAVLDRYGTLGGTDLSDEAALLRIEALAAQGRGAEAAEQARRFTEEHPDSPLAERARRLGGLNLDAQPR